MQIISYLKKKKVVCTSAIIENKKIARNDIEKHLMLFHKFINSENENFCEVCDTVEIFNTSKDLLEHILNVHEGENSNNKPDPEIESLEDGKSIFF